ncbi:MAG: class I tRNA ligase family protein, partial [Clostridia bacterium]
DLCVSRTSFTWGIPVDFDSEHTIYVWIDALTNYITALGYLQNDDANFKKFWPADVHVVGKEIVRFHAIIWPALLMALDLPLPKKIMGHGWMIVGGGKLSKSKETGKKEVFDPRILIERYGSDSVRNFLIGDIPFGSDGPYSQELFLNSFNTNLSNTIGNVVSRTAGMASKYNGGILETDGNLSEEDKVFQKNVLNLKSECIALMKELKSTQSYKKALAILEECNRYIDEVAPWALAKDENKKQQLNNFLFNLAEGSLEAYTLLLPFLPEKVATVFEKFNLAVPNTFDMDKAFNHLKNGQSILKGENLYNRLDIQKETEELYQIANQ